MAFVDHCHTFTVFLVNIPSFPDSDSVLSITIQSCSKGKRCYFRRW